MSFFAAEANIIKALKPLADVGLGYLQLGQPVPTLSGGESQRLKLAAHLAKGLTSKSKKTTKKRSTTAAKAKASDASGSLFLFDEPTTGLHFHDIDKLLDAFRQLLEQGHSLVVIEHNLDIVANAEWVIDMGPEGGDEGGEIVYAGSIEEFKSGTSKNLKPAKTQKTSKKTRQTD